MGEIDIWNDDAIAISQDDLTIAPIVLEPVKVDFSLPETK